MLFVANSSITSLANRSLALVKHSQTPNTNSHILIKNPNSTAWLWKLCRCVYIYKLLWKTKYRFSNFCSHGNHDGVLVAIIIDSKYPLDVINYQTAIVGCSPSESPADMRTFKSTGVRRCLRYVASPRNWLALFEVVTYKIRLHITTIGTWARPGASHWISWHSKTISIHVICTIIYVHIHVQ